MTATTEEETESFSNICCRWLDTVRSLTCKRRAISFRFIPWEEDPYIFVRRRRALRGHGIMIAQKRNLKRETRFTLLRRDYTGNPRLEKKMPLTRRFLFCARGII